MKAAVTLYVMFCAQVADWTTTVYMLGLGGVEANPLMRPLFEVSPWLALLPKLGVVLLAWWVYSRVKKLSWLVFVTVLSSLPVIWNVGQLVWFGL